MNHIHKLYIWNLGTGSLLPFWLLRVGANASAWFCESHFVILNLPVPTCCIVTKSPVGQPVAFCIILNTVPDKIKEVFSVCQPCENWVDTQRFGNCTCVHHQELLWWDLHEIRLSDHPGPIQSPAVGIGNWQITDLQNEWSFTFTSPVRLHDILVWHWDNFGFNKSNLNYGWSVYWKGSVHPRMSLRTRTRIRICDGAFCMLK
jgi:hypothetical protein